MSWGLRGAVSAFGGWGGRKCSERDDPGRPENHQNGELLEKPTKHRSLPTREQSAASNTDQGSTDEETGFETGYFIWSLRVRQ